VYSILQSAPEGYDIKPLEHEQKADSGTVFDVSVPPGVPPHGFFQALCGGVVVDVQAPPDAYPGQLVRIDLGTGTDNK
jgi:hypothetical protein